MQTTKMTNQQLVEAAVKADQELKAKKTELDSYKAELQARGGTYMENQNIKYVKFHSPVGSVAVMDSQKLETLNVDKLKGIIGDGVFGQKVKITTKTEYKFDTRLERALKAIFTGDYSFEFPLERFLDMMTVPVTPAQKKLLLKKLKGDYVQDKRNMLIILGYMTKDDDEDKVHAPDLDAELWFIYRIKNAELIQSYLPDGDIEEAMEEIRKCILVDTSTSVTVDYEKEERK